MGVASDWTLHQRCAILAAMTETHDLEADILVVGGGLAGLTLGIALADAGLETAVVDRLDPDATLDTAFDGRTTALAAGSVRVLDGIGLWPLLAADAQPILDIRVADGHPSRGVSPLFLHYDHREAGRGPMGYIVENRAIRTALYARAAALPRLRLIAPAQVRDVARTAARATATLADGRRVRAALAVAADGRGSPLRKAAGIPVAEWSYGQTAIVCTVAHERDHAGVAVELFLPGGPFAMLPLNGARTNIVWSERADLVPRLLALDDRNFLAEVARRFGDWLGPLALVGPRFSYPLGLMLAARYTDRRLALIGEAAHAIHPIAGQGLNLGIRDIAALAEAVVDSRRLGLDPGDAGTLTRYERWRRVDTLTLAAVTDAMNRLFSNDIAPLRLVRDLGLAAVHRAAPLRRFFMQHAMGFVGDLPRLVRGEKL